MKIPWVVFVHDSVFLVLGTMICRDSNIVQGFLGMLQQTHRSTVGNLLFLIFPRNLGKSGKIYAEKIVDLGIIQFKDNPVGGQ